MTTRADVVVVGAGIAGSALAFELAAHAAVVLLERETQPGYHSTGRSAAMLTETYGTPVVRVLARGSRAFLERPPEGFADTPLLEPRGMLHVARADQVAALEAAHRLAGSVPGILRLSGAEVRALAPLIDPAYPAGGLFEPDARAIDVAALHQGYLHGFRRRGGTLVTDAEVTGLARGARGWEVATTAGAFSSETLVDAAGAWADPLAALAGILPLGLVAKRRTAVLLEPPADLDPKSWPMVIDVDERFYVKPEAGLLLVSPADETPVAPGDVQPEELDVAVAIDRYQRLTGRSVRRVVRRWAGLRTFARDHDPVIGCDPEAPTFFWLAGQGGFGIMTAPAMARIGAALIATGRMPEDLGLAPGRLGPERLRTA